MERDILKKAAAFFAEAAAGSLRVDRRGEGQHSGTHALSDVRRVAERVLRLAHATGIDAGAGRPPAEGPGARVVHGRPRLLRQPADPRRLRRVAGARQPQADHSADAGRGPEGARAQAVQGHDDERSRPAGRGQSARSRSSRRSGRISAGSATRPSCASARAASCTWRSSSICSRGSSSGWAVSAVNDRHLTIKALEMALKRRCPEVGLLHHSDQGSHVRQRGLPGGPRGPRHHLQHEPPRQLLRQRRDGSVLLDGQERARANGSTATARRRWSCSTTSKCSITSGVGTRQQVG